MLFEERKDSPGQVSLPRSPPWGLKTLSEDNIILGSTVYLCSESGHISDSYSISPISLRN